MAGLWSNYKIGKLARFRLPNKRKLLINAIKWMNELINMEEEANYNWPMEFVPGSTISRDKVEVRDNSK